MFLGMGERTSIDIDIVVEDSSFDRNLLKRATEKAGLIFNPTGDFEPDTPYLQLVEPDNPVVSFGDYAKTVKLPGAPVNNAGISIKSIPAENVIASKLCRATEKDNDDIKFLLENDKSITKEKVGDVIETFDNPGNISKARENLIIVEVLRMNSDSEMSDTSSDSPGFSDDDDAFWDGDGIGDFD
jgi:uncharacterized protein YkvS